MNEMAGGPRPKKSGASRVQVSVTVAEEDLDHFDDVVARCEKVGLTDVQPLEAIGIITGAISSRKLAALRRVKGVAYVELSQQYQLPPPDSSIQ